MAMDDRTCKVGVVGMGIGRGHAEAFARHPRCELLYLCDLLEHRMAEVATHLPNTPRMTTSVEEMCNDPELDAVFVGTPNQWHVPVALEALGAGKHVMVTKPLSDSLDAAREVVQAAEASGLVNMMSLTTRFGRECQYLGQLARDGAFGELYYARASSVRRIGIPHWSLGFIEEGGGAFRDMGVHVLDAVWWILGMPKPASVLGVAGAKFGPRGEAYMGPVEPDFYERFAADDYGGGFIRFDNGLGLQVDSFWASHQAPEFQMEIFGTDAGARYDPLTVFRTRDGSLEDVSVRPHGPNEPADLIADHFVACILDGATCKAPLRHGYVVQVMMEALLESAETGQAVTMADL